MPVMSYVQTSSTDNLVEQGTCLVMDSSMPVSSCVKTLSTDNLVEVMIDSERLLMSLVMPPQLTLENIKNFLGFCHIN